MGFALGGGKLIRAGLIVAFSSLGAGIMSGFGRKITAAAVAMSLCAVPTAAIGAAPIAPAASAPVAAAPASPWVALSAMTTGSSASSAALAAQGEGDPGFPPIAPLVVILATIAVGVFILVKDDDDRLDGIPISPS